mgnify:CR=1 FL=1
MTDANTLKRNTAWLSIMSNTLLVILKLAVGLYVGAVSLVSEALHSGVDLIAAFIRSAISLAPLSCDCQERYQLMLFPYSS